MRLILGMTFGLGALTGLAACGQSEEALRNTTREALLLGCRNGPASDRATLTQAGISVDRYCTCAVDRFLRTQSREQIKELARNPNNVPGLEAAAGQCISEMMPGAAAANEAAGNETTPAAPAPEAPAPAAEEGEATEGNEAAGQ